MSKSRRTIHDDFGSLVRRLREKKGYSTQQLAELANITGGYLNRIETGKRKRPGYIVVEDLANALCVDTAVLLSACVDKNNRENATLEQLFYSHEFGIGEIQHVSSDVKDILLNLIDTIFDVDWESETILADSHEILKLVQQLKEELEN